jgi:hypothetical protein
MANTPEERLATLRQKGPPKPPRDGRSDPTWPQRAAAYQKALESAQAAVREAPEVREAREAEKRARQAERALALEGGGFQGSTILHGEIEQTPEVQAMVKETVEDLMKAVKSSLAQDPRARKKVLGPRGRAPKAPRSRPSSKAPAASRARRRRGPRAR